MGRGEEAQVEDEGVRGLMAQSEAATEIGGAYDAKVKVLGEYIKHHVKEEENEIFPSISSEKDALDELGQELSSRKEELIDELGLAQDDEEDEEDVRSAAGGRSPPRESTQRRR